MISTAIKARKPSSTTYLQWTSKFELCAVTCGSKHEHQSDVCLKEIGQRVQVLFDHLDSIINMVGAGKEGYGITTVMAS